MLGLTLLLWVRARHCTERGVGRGWGGKAQFTAPCLCTCLNTPHHNACNSVSGTSHLAAPTPGLTATPHPLHTYGHVCAPTEAKSKKQQVCLQHELMVHRNSENIKWWIFCRDNKGYFHHWWSRHPTDGWLGTAGSHTHTGEASHRVRLGSFCTCTPPSEHLMHAALPHDLSSFKWWHSVKWRPLPWPQKRHINVAIQYSF